jgi:hypothetical protein
MTPVTPRTRRLAAAAIGVMVGASSLAACAQAASYSDELVCGDLVPHAGSQGFVTGSCDADHTGERFFVFESPFDVYDSGDIETASLRYCLQRFLSHYDLQGKWYPEEFDYVGVAPDVGTWNQGNHQIECVAFRPDGSVLP